MPDTRSIRLEVLYDDQTWVIYGTDAMPIDKAPQPWCEGFIAGYLGDTPWTFFVATVHENDAPIACYCSEKEDGLMSCQLCNRCPAPQWAALLSGVPDA